MEQYFHVVLFTVLYNVVQAFQSVDEIAAREISSLLGSQVFGRYLTCYDISSMTIVWLEVAPVRSCAHHYFQHLVWDPRSWKKKLKTTKHHFLSCSLPEDSNRVNGFFFHILGAFLWDDPVSDHCASKEPLNLCPEWIQRFL